jgi:hypothetical protein
MVTQSQAKDILNLVFSPAQLRELRACKTTDERTAITARLLDLINEKTGQKNDPRYWAYLCEWALED